MTGQISSAGVLRGLLKADPIVVVPGIYDALSAWLATQAGFPAVFVSGSALAYTQLARPDVNLLSVTEVATTVERIRDRITLPILVDADSGYGSAVNLMRTVRMLERAGASAIQIEDQINFKAPGALSARPLISAAEMVGKIKAAQDARSDDQTVISARTDAAFSLGFDEALRRAVAYADAGADMIFVEGLTDPAQMRGLVNELGGRVPLLHNVTGNGRSSPKTAVEVEALGYDMALFSGETVQAAATATAHILKDLRLNGTAGPSAGRLDARALNAILETPEFLEAAKAYDPVAQTVPTLPL